MLEWVLSKISAQICLAWKRGPLRPTLFVSQSDHSSACRRITCICRADGFTGSYVFAANACQRGISAFGYCHMLKVYSCIANAHDLKLVALAALICVLASFAAINLLRHARKSNGRMRGIWLAISAISTGFGIWATHFVAMLAFTPGIPSGYNIILTILSLVVAILLTGAGLAVSLVRDWRAAPWLGGAIVAGGIAAMHYTGMAAFEIGGIILWDPTLVTSAIACGAVIGSGSL